MTLQEAELKENENNEQILKRSEKWVYLYFTFRLFERRSMD